ncbi:hypothetical protein [Parabacteroides distasonis]|uniref:hypothetical protein n=1 Tax=Parabacteroides distasonis TaxID=823 RepID=UPI0013643BBB|nr:hypothetical protein [Parabacteroides distasonis]
MIQKRKKKDVSPLLQTYAEGRIRQKQALNKMVSLLRNLTDDPQVGTQAKDNLRQVEE